MGTRWFSKILSCPHQKYMIMGILSPSDIFRKHGDKMIFKNPIFSPYKIYDNGDLVSIRNIYEAWRQDDFQKFLSCPHQNYMIMGILSPWKVFTKHGDKMIFKNPILSPSKIYDNWDLVSIRNIYKAWGQDDYQKSYLVPIKNTW